MGDPLWNGVPTLGVDDLPSTPDSWKGGGVILGAGQRIDDLPLEVQSKAMRARAKKWQVECLDYAEAIGEAGYGTDQLADLMSKVVVYPAIRFTRDGDPIDALDREAVKKGLADNPQADDRGIHPDGTVDGAQELADALDRLDEGHDEGLPGVLRSCTWNHQLAGDMSVVGRKVGGREQWEVRSVDALQRRQDGVYVLKDDRDAQAEELDPAAYVGRLWNKSPRYPREATSPMRRVRLQCDELLILDRSIRGAAKSRGQAGLVLFPQGFRIIGMNPAKDATPGADETGLPHQIQQAMKIGIENEASPIATIPLMLEGPGEQIDKVKHLLLERPLDQIASDIRNYLVRRIGQGLNFPVEIVSGLAEVNHWSAWQITEQLFSSNLEPIALSLCRGLWSAYAMPVAMAGAALSLASTNGDRPTVPRNSSPVALAPRLTLWYDASALIQHVNSAEEVREGYVLGEVSGEALRRHGIGLGEDARPTDDELAERGRRAKLAGISTGGQQSMFGGDEQEDTGQRGTPPMERPAPEAPAAMAAAATTTRPNPGRRLAEMDRRLRTRLQAAASAAVQRALERAGTRLRRLAQKDDAITAAANGLPNAEVAAALGEAVARELLSRRRGEALTAASDDLLAGEFDDLGDEFDADVAATQANARRVLRRELAMEDAELAELERTQDERRGEASGAFVAALAALAAARLFDPHPRATPGEVDGMTVPPGLVREALAQAGGGRIGTEGPQGGVAAGVDVLELFRSRGRLVSGWRWIHGDPRVPFDPHEALDGVEFPTWDSPVLAVAGDDWLGVARYQPGDHLGCTCDFEPVLLEEPTEEAA